MTREEQIYFEIDKHKYHADRPFDYETGFMHGVKWADEHPKPDMVNKQEFVEKAWQWLKTHIKFETVTYSDVWDTSIVDILATDFNTVDEMEESFRKIMEE